LSPLETSKLVWNLRWARLGVLLTLRGTASTWRTSRAERGPTEWDS